MSYGHDIATSNMVPLLPSSLSSITILRTPSSMQALALVSLLLLALAGILRRLWQSRTTYRNGIPTPPRLNNWFPFIGSAISMTLGDSFWVQAEQRHGPVFRVLAMGDEKVFTTDPGVISWVYRNAKTCDFHCIRRHMTSYIYGMKPSLAFSDVWDGLFQVHHRALSPGMLEELNNRYVDHLEAVMAHGLQSVTRRKRVDLVDWVFDTMYTASAKAYFSPSFPVAEALAPFKAFDKAFPLLAVETLPSFLVSSARKTVVDMHNLLIGWWKEIRTDPKVREVLAPSLACMLDVGEVDGWSDGCMMSTILAELWALEANAPYAAMWTVLELARRPELYLTLQNEVLHATQVTSPPSTAALLRLDQRQLVARCPQLNAAYQETLRVHSESFPIRKVIEPLTIPANLLKSGPGSELGLRLEKDDQIVCVTRRHAISPDSEWGRDAAIWDHKRFLKTGSRKEQMWPFGGGVSMCEGRHFASLEILTFLIAFISTYNIDIVSDSIQADRTRIGLGMMHPVGKAIVDLVRK